MPNFSKYSAFYDSLSDDQAYYYYEKELISKTVHQNNNNQFKDKTTFSGEVLVPCQECAHVTPLGSGVGETVFVTKMRLDDIDANMYDHPSDITDPQRKQAITDQHQTAYISLDPSVSALPKPGDKVECYYQEAGPNENGKQRGLRFKPEITSTSDSSIAEFNAQILQGTFANGAAMPLGKFAGKQAPEFNTGSYQKPDEGFLKRAYESFGATYVPPIVGDTRLVAVRFPHKQSNVNKFSDVLNVFYGTPSGIQIKSYQITTIPGKHVLREHLYSNAGTGIVATGFTPEMWGLDKHRGDYLAGSQGRPWKVKRPTNPSRSTYYVRDANRNGVGDFEPDGTDMVYQQYGSKGFNLHRSGPNYSTRISGQDRVTDKRISYIVDSTGRVRKVKQGVWTYSGGCQVFPDFGNFEELIGVWVNNRQKNKIITYDYIMLEHSEYKTLIAGGTFDGVSKMKKRAQIR